MSYRLLYLFLAALGMRLLFLNQSFWLDEVITANVVQNLSFSQILAQFSPTDFHPPLYYFVMKAWSALFGVSEVSLRLVSVFASLAAGFCVYCIAQKRYSSTTAYYATALFLLNPLIVYYSQEARMYMLSVFFLSLVLAAYHFPGEKRWVIAGVIGTVGAMTTFYGSLFFLLALGFYALYTKRYHFLIWFVITGVGTGLLLVPLLQQQLPNAGVALSTVSGWSQTLGLVTLKNMLLIPMKFVIGRISFEPKLLYYACTVGMLVLASSLVTLPWLNTRYRLTKESAGSALRNHGLLYFLLLIPLVLATIVSVQYPMLQYFRFLFLLIPLSIIYAVGSKRLPWLRITFIAGCIVFSMVYLLNPYFHREDWKHILVSVPAAEPVYVIQAVSDPLQYYYPGRETRDLQRLSENPPTESRISIIPYATDIFGVAYTDTLQTFGYSKQTVTYFQGVPLELWVKNGSSQ